MGSTQALDAPQASQRNGLPPLEPAPKGQSPLIGGEVDFLREENRQLRELVIWLSKIVIENVVQRH
jgi:hypothetical protein